MSQPLFSAWETRMNKINKDPSFMEFTFKLRKKRNNLKIT